MISILSVLFLLYRHDVMTCQRDTMQTHQQHKLTGTIQSIGQSEASQAQSEASQTASVCTAAIAVQRAINQCILRRYPIQHMSVDHFTLTNSAHASSHSAHQTNFETTDTKVGFLTLPGNQGVPVNGRTHAGRCAPQTLPVASPAAALASLDTAPRSLLTAAATQAAPTETGQKSAPPVYLG
mgnify:CR=1 FL=1